MRNPFRVRRGAWLAIWVVVASAALAEEPHEEVTIDNGEVRLAATLVRPAAEAGYPGVVFIHGSGPHKRAGPLAFASAFTDAGVGLLAFDKRGSGESTGAHWGSSSLEDLSEDVLAAVEFLRRQAGFDPDRIGLWGVSQGGWLAPMVAERDGNLAFVIVTSGGGASPLQSELFSYGQVFDRAKLSVRDRAAAMALLGDYFRYLGTGEDRAGLMAAIGRAREESWYAALNIGRIVPSEANRPNWAWVANFDPMPGIARLTAPVLLVFGDQDRDQPTELAIERWRQGLALAGNDRVTVRVFEGANHGIRSGDHSHGKRPPLVDGYPEVITTWLEQNIAGDRTER
ncbi:MAG: alpha/beta fold hydrolase [Pseudomonadota bacterium]